MIFKYEMICKELLKLNNVAIASKFGSKISEDAAKMVAKKLLSKKIKVYTIAPVEMSGAKQIESLDQLTKVKLDFLDFKLAFPGNLNNKIRSSGP